MSGDTVYRVRVQYETETGGATKALGAMGAAASSLSSTLGSLGSGLRALGTAAIVGAGVGLAGLALLGRAIAEVGSKTEDTTIAIAGMMRAGGATSDWAQSMGVAESLMEKIRREAAALPGEAEDFITVFQSGLAKGLEAGLDPEQVADMSNRFAAVGIAHGVDAPQTGRDLNLLLSGRAGASVRMWGVLGANIGRAGRELHISANSAKEFNQVRAEDRVRLVNAALGKYKDMLDAFRDTWSAQAGTFKSNLKDLFRIASKPVFEAMKDELKWINNWFERNSDVIKGVARGIGLALANAFRRADTALERMGERMAEFGESDTFRRLSGMVSRGAGAVGGMIDRVRESPGAAAGMAAGALGLAAGVPGLGLLAGGVANFVTEHRAEFDATLASLGEGLASLGGLVGPVAGTFGVLQEMIGTLLAGALPGIAEAVGYVLQSVSLAGQMIFGSVTGLLDAIFPSIGRLGGALGDLLSAVGDVLGPVVRIVGGLLSQVFDKVRTHLAPTFNQLAEAISSFIHWLADQLRRFGVELNAAAPGLINRPGGQPAPTNGQSLGEILASMRDRLNNPARTQNAQANANRRRGAASPGKTNVSVRIEQTIHDASDPARVLVNTRRAIRQALEFPIESPGNGAHVLR
jgi:hypothetical protein